MVNTYVKRVNDERILRNARLMDMEIEVEGAAARQRRFVIPAIPRA
tara:strand:+ start:3284 stop:3421 length:138 start_codon:yes stop_codon:yes gene_type:complete